MKTLAAIFIALVGGFIAGLLLSELIGIAGMLIIRQPVGIKFLPVYLALLSAFLTLVISFAVCRR